MRDYPLILLCGGKSERMGIPKGLLEFDKSPLFLHHIKKFRSGGGSHVILVLGYHIGRYQEFITWTGDIFNDRWNPYDGIKVAIAVNNDPQRGQFSSVITGLERFSGEDFKGAFIMPVDMLPPGKETWKFLVSGLSGKVKACIPAYRNKGGHPVLVSPSFVQDLLAVPMASTDARLDIQLARLPGDWVKYVEVKDENVTGNLNTPGEFQNLKSPGF